MYFIPIIFTYLLLLDEYRGHYNVAFVLTQASLSLKISENACNASTIEYYTR